MNTKVTEFDKLEKEEKTKIKYRKLIRSHN